MTQISETPCVLILNPEIISGGSAAVGVVTELVDVHATLGARVVAGDVPRDGGGGGLGGLLERDGSLDVRVSSEDGD